VSRHPAGSVLTFATDASISFSRQRIEVPLSRAFPVLGEINIRKGEVGKTHIIHNVSRTLVVHWVDHCAKKKSVTQSSGYEVRIGERHTLVVAVYLVAVQVRRLAAVP
jgi:hypothetical protein